jgi:beta-glucosidase
MVYDYLKKTHAEKPVGISHNCALFTAHNILGMLPAKLADLWYMEYLPTYFTRSDYIGLSYYARIAYDPFPISYLYTPEKIKKYNKKHDDIWEYHPEGLKSCLYRYSKFKKPIIIAENGICTTDDTLRINSIKDYMKIIHEAMHDGIDILAYYHWSTWDNFEWTLGPTYRFGLYECDLETMSRSKKPSADIYAKLAFQKEIEV